MLSRFSVFLAALLALAFVPRPAAACGGFFCNAAQPVNQAAERIIFAQHADGEVTALIEIQYEGPAETFAWMLPVDGRPEISVSSVTAFDRLQAASNPLYQLNQVIEGRCIDGGGFGRGGFAFASDSTAAPEAAPGGEPGVTVVDEGTVGPYDFVILNVDDVPEGDEARVAIEWLQDNAFDVPDLGADRLAPYLAGGMNLLAFRLTKGSDTGAIRPVRLSFGAGAPSIPLRPTAVAAEDDMGIMVWVLGDSRAYPQNYASLELNEALIDWINPGDNYDEVVTQAANEGNGQGFVTEQAGRADRFSESIIARWERQQLADLADRDWTDRHGDLVIEAYGMVNGWDGSAALLLRHVPLPDGVSEEDFTQRPWAHIARGGTIEGFVPEAFLADLQDEVVDPMIETAALFDEIPYVTRFYTTMSADEMTRDPVFDFNPDLGDVDNFHNATQVVECSPSISVQDAPWRIELPDGQIIRGEGQDWPLDVSPEIPAAARIMMGAPSGEGAVLTDNEEAIREIVRSSNARFGNGLGCAVGGRSAGSSTLLGLLAALGLVLRRRRRRS
jgi:MYXO-CTERM domain-containing protein